jgi:diketogulonate reductase-like aldo/keto reductase
MPPIDKSGTFTFGDCTVKRLAPCSSRAPAYLARPRIAKLRSPYLREAVATGVNHIDTSDFYGPHVTNQIIREALHPYPDDLVIVTKVSARRGADGSWLPAMSPPELTAAVHDNLRNLGLDVLEVVNLQQHARHSRTRRRLDRSTAHRARRAAAAGPYPPYRIEQRSSRKAAASATSSVCRTCTTWRIAPTTR